VLISAGLMLVFLGALAFNLARGLDIYCGCFTTHSADPISLLTIIRDFLFFLLSLYLFWLYQLRGVEKKFSLVQVFRRVCSESVAS
jgi:hypothetical protein